MYKSILLSTLLLTFSLSSEAALFSSEIKTEKINKFLADTESKIPSSIQSAVLKRNKNQPLEVEFKSLGELQLPKCDLVVDSFSAAASAEAALQGAQKQVKTDEVRYNQGVYSAVEAKKNKLILNKALLAYIEGAAVNYNCEHKDSYKLAQGALINAIARLLDAPVRVQAKSNKQSSADYSFSGSQQYRYKAGWDKDGNTEKDKRQAFWPRAINPYEYAGTVHDHFALNIEFFLLDPEYACRRPLIHEYLVSLFKIDPLQNERNCKVNTELRIPYKVSDIDLEAGSVKDSYVLANYNLDPARVYNVNYFLAGIGGGAGAFGHSMFRIVTCDNPNLPMTSENCQKRQGNLIINPRANPLEMRLDNMKGAFGGYPSMFLVNPTHEIIEEYSVSELRNSYNIPLTSYQTVDEAGKSVNIMNPDDKRRFLYAVLDQYWGYYGNYKFLSNNCADEALWLYQMSTENKKVLSEDPGMTKSKPFQIANILSDAGLADTEYLYQQEKDKGIFAALIGMLTKSGNKMKWDDFEEKCDVFSEMEFNKRVTHKSWKCHFYGALREIMILEGAKGKEVDNTNDVIKEFKGWIKLATPSKKVSKEQAVNFSENQELDATREQELLRQTVLQIRNKWLKHFDKAQTKEDKIKITQYFYTVIYHLYWKRAQEIGSDAIQLAYEISYHRGKRGSKGAVELPKNLKVSVEQQAIIKEAIDKYAELERSLMPYRELSIAKGSGYGIPLESEVVRDARFTDLMNIEYEYLKNVVDAVSGLLGAEHLILKDLGLLHEEIAEARYSIEKN